MEILNGSNKVSGDSELLEPREPFVKTFRLACVQTGGVERGRGVGCGFGVGVALGVPVGVGVGVTVAVAVAVGAIVGVGVGLDAAAQYLPPVFK